MDTTREYYLKNIGILDLQSNNWTYYVSGAERTAKITPKAYQQPKNISSSSPAILNDTLAASFYLYDHLGNTRVVYYPEVQCPTFVTYTIENATDYYPYGKTLRQFSAEFPPEKFLSTQHERDVETGLDYRGARFYDGDIARFLSLDPLAANYPSLSDYSYVACNPLVFVDPTGMAVEDIYTVDDNGHVTLQKRTDHTFDIIHRVDANGNHIKGSALKVNDQTILSGLASERPSSDYDGSYTISSNKSELFKVFAYMADNTGVEWAISGFRTDSDNEYILTTSHIGEDHYNVLGFMYVASSTTINGYDLLNMIFSIHSHPGTSTWEGTKGASGDIENSTLQTGDMSHISDKYRYFRSRGMTSMGQWFQVGNQWTVFPKYYVYHKQSNTLFHYTPWVNDIYIRSVTNYSDFYRNLGF